MLNDWLFYKGNLENGYIDSLDESNFEKVKVPHTFNAVDGQRGCDNNKNIKITDYYQGESWYRCRASFDDNDLSKRVFLRFEGVNSQCRVYVNEKEVGSHKGGYTAFCFEISDYIHSGNDNLIAVWVSNAKVPEIAPLQADFTFYGGIYRDVEIIKKEKISFCITDKGTRGLKVTALDVSRESARCIFDTVAQNKTDERQRVMVSAEFGDDYSEVKTLELEAGESRAVSFNFNISSPHLWHGRKDPYLYPVSVSLSQNGILLDKISDEIGLRYYNISIKEGFFLNGEKYPLRGVSRHQDREGLGNALTKAEHDEDFKILYDIGATAVRLAHYPQAEYFYRLCDRAGILAWAEIPFVELIGGDGSFDKPNDERRAFFDCTKAQLEEMICQNFNHPSIFCWGIQNEILMKYDDIMIPFTKELHTLAKRLDPYRYTTQATNQKTAYNWTSDLICWNVYPGWYGMSRKALGRFMDGMKTSRPLGISEYGAGANYRHQENNPKRVVHNGQWHPEKYQTISHEAFLKSIDKRDYLWCTFVWNLFDFGSNGRNEGERPGMNDKGLVSFDRKVKKDAYYLYQAHWSDEHILQIAESRYTKRREKKADIKVFSNSDSVTLYLNDKKLSTKLQRDNKLKGVFVWQNARLSNGVNIITAQGKRGESLLSQELTVFCDKKFPKRQRL